MTSITACITVFNREEISIFVVEKILSSDPQPDEILIHVDGGRFEFAERLRKKWPDIIVVVSESNIGPGGGRNKLLEMSVNGWVAFFDDDSWPSDSNYFKSCRALIETYPDTAVFTFEVEENGRLIYGLPHRSIFNVLSYNGCACLVNAQKLISCGGYVPVPDAYGVEEIDMALRLFDAGEKIKATNEIIVIHKPLTARHESTLVNVATVANIGLHGFLRFPVLLWVLIPIKMWFRVRWLQKHRRRVNIFDIINETSKRITKYKTYRCPVRFISVIKYYGPSSFHVEHDLKNIM
jgi:GT2 family glycosyltransferase